MCFLAKNRLEIVPLTIGKQPEIRSKISDFTYKAFWRHFWPPVGPPRPPQGDPRRPKAAQGWAPGRAWLLKGLHFGAIFKSIFIMFLGFVLGSGFLWFGRRFGCHLAFISGVFSSCCFDLCEKCWTLRMYCACQSKQGSGPSKFDQKSL